MIFSSGIFFVFLLAVLALYQAARTIEQRAAVLLAASLVFYASWKPVYVVLLGASLTINFAIYNALLRRPRRSVLAFGIALNLIVLGLFKYFGLVVETAIWIVLKVKMADDIHSPGWIAWALPLGISFYTFHMLSAMIDVYRGDWAKPITFRVWCLYVTFFPHLIAGPILRPGQLIDQLGELERIRGDGFRLGTAIFIAGLAKKVLLADNLASICDKLLAAPDGLTFATAWVATLSFSFQIYYDFSGYSEMAIGLARMFGVALPRNFLYPYIARNPSEFWRRWHITLSQWLRDYLYIPLGGSRGSEAQTYRNLLMTMLLGGLWHGANWTFVFWGGLHGLYLAGWRVFDIGLGRAGIARGSTTDRWMSLAGIPMTFLMVCFTWVFFRCPSFDIAWKVSGAMLGMGHTHDPIATVRTYELLIVAFSGLLAFVEPFVVGIFERRGITWWWRVPFPIRGGVYAVVVLGLLAFGGTTQKFIYFDF